MPVEFPGLSQLNTPSIKIPNKSKMKKDEKHVKLSQLNFPGILHSQGYPCHKPHNMFYVI